MDYLNEVIEQRYSVQSIRKDYQAGNPMKWRGKNLLGCALMQVRDELLI